MISTQSVGIRALPGTIRDWWRPNTCPPAKAYGGKSNGLIPRLPLRTPGLVQRPNRQTVCLRARLARSPGGTGRPG